MKKNILTLLFTFITIVSFAQKHDLPDEFFGLKFNEKYSPEQIQEALKGNGTYYEFDNTEPYVENGVPYYRYGFENASYNGRTYDLIGITTTTKGVLAQVCFNYFNDSDTSEAIDSVYEEVKSELTETYAMFSIPAQNDIVADRMLCINEGASRVLRLTKYTEEGQTSMIEINYYAFETMANDLPEIQDTFYGMKMGSYQTTSSIKSSVENRGTFIEERDLSFGMVVSFYNVSFAGDVWQYASFYTTENGLLYEVDFQKSFEESDSDSEEFNQAEQNYNTYKAKLNDKYGEHDEREFETGKYISYNGKNHMSAVLSNEVSLSKGSSYRRYVSLTYTQEDYYQEKMDYLKEQSNNEL